jgi:hypothetical protein
MGTNYYTAKHCPTCGHKEEDKHIGKSSGGWQFSFQWNGGKYYKNYKELIAWLKGRTIINEYGEEISLDDFIKLVESKQSEKSNHALISPSERDFVIDGYSFTDCEFS